MNKKQTSLLSIRFIEFNINNIENLADIFDGEFKGYFDINENLEIISSNRPIYFSPEYILLYKDDLVSYVKENKLLMSVINK